MDTEIEEQKTQENSEDVTKEFQELFSTWEGINSVFNPPPGIAAMWEEFDRYLEIGE